MAKLFGNDLDNKMLNDLIVSFIVCFTYVSCNNVVAGIASGIIISIAAAGFFTLMSEIVRTLAEVDLEMGKFSKEEAVRKYEMRLVLRDAIVTFVAAYGLMTSAFVGVLTLKVTAPYMIAALMPALFIAIVSSEIRAPFLREYRGYNVAFK